MQNKNLLSELQNASCYWVNYHDFGLSFSETSLSSVKKDEALINLNGGSMSGGPLSEQGYKFLEQFNRDMMDQFMEHQRRTQASFTRWEQERWRQERESMERWRQEARDHERQLFGMFCTAMAKCNAAITAVLKAKSVVSNGSRKRVRSEGHPGEVSLKKAKEEEINEEEIDDDEGAGGGDADEATELENEIHDMVKVDLEEGSIWENSIWCTKIKQR